MGDSRSQATGDAVHGSPRRTPVAERRPRRADRGATLIEFAIVAPLLLALVFGIIDFGFALNDTIAVRQGAREGARQAVTGRVGSDTSCTPVSSTTPNNTTERLVCLVKDRVDVDPSRVRVKVNVQNPYAEGNGIQVCVMARLDSITGFYGVLLDDRVVQSAVQMRVEQTDDQASGADSDDLTSFEEAPLPGGNSWNCTLEPAG